MPIGEPSKTPSAAVIGARKASLDSEESDKRDDASQEGLDTTETGMYIGARREKPRGFWSSVWKHFKRYWLCYALLGVIFLAIFLPVL